MCLTCNDAKSEDECREKGKLQTCPRHQVRFIISKTFQWHVV